MKRGLEADIQKIGREIFTEIERKKPSVFARDYWQSQVMEWSMRDEAFKVELFRFVDVFPVLNNAADVAQHLQEYFGRPGQDFPRALQWGVGAVKPTSLVARVAAKQIEKNIKRMASQFIAGRGAAQALDKLESLRASGVGFTIDLLGEACVSEVEADDYQRRYIELIDVLSRRTRRWKSEPRVESERFPRVNVSIKLSALYSQLDPIAPETSIDAVVERLRPILRLASERGALINLDVERYAHKDLTYDVIERLLSDPDFAWGPELGCVVQAYLRDSERDLQRLIKLAKKHRRLTIRLVKGAYWDYEVIHAQQEGWPIPVYTRKSATDANFEHLATLLIEAAPTVTPAIASHNVRSIAVAIAAAKRRGLDRDGFELQMLYGMADPLKSAITKQGWRLRDYVPVGELVPGMAYLVRRLLENTSNESWLRQGFVEHQSVQTLLAEPDATPETPPTPPEGVFENTPLLDFSQETSRRRLHNALQRTRRRLPLRAAPWINGEERTGGSTIRRFNPGAKDELIGAFIAADAEQADEAVAAASRAFPAWRATGPEARARLLQDVASRMRRDRDDLTALIVLEVGKDWRGADGDVCEAIDFLEYYAKEMLRLAPPRQLGHHQGELNHLLYEPRGVCVVIAPWNFPLAILTGMTAAALVAGNTVVMKPAEQSTLIAAELWRHFQQAGVPAGVLNLLPGRGEEVGARLVAHPDVATIAFTGSQAVGLEIYRQAGITHPGQVHLKRVICELGGKNAIIVDDDADLDEAVEGVLHSAFGFQGQKCSACSRVIILKNQATTFVERLAAGLRALRIAPPEDPASQLGPVIDEEAQAAILEHLRRAREEGRIVAQREAPTSGHYVPATIVADVSPTARVAQEEIFGPVLCVIEVGTFEEALEVALATPYALTAGLYSRSPQNIERAREVLRVGNLYINRSCIGALVGRQPFGGAARSGVGSKAGGPDYLLQFMIPRVITENTMRRGFAPTQRS